MFLHINGNVKMLLLLLLLLRQMVEKLSHHHSGIPVEFDGVLEHLFVRIEFRAVQQMFLIRGGV